MTLFHPSSPTCTTRLNPSAGGCSPPSASSARPAMKHTAALLLSCALGLWSLPASGADVLTLSRAIERATARHPMIRAAEAGVEAARAREAQARAFPNPALSLQAEEMPVANPLSGNLMAGLSVPLPIGGAREGRAAIARLETATAETEILDQRRALILVVKSAYAQVVHHAERMRLAQGGLSDAERLLRAAETRYRAGDVPRVEVFRADVERSRAQRDLQLVEGQLVMAKRRLGLLIGQEVAEELSVAALPAPAARQLPALRALAEQMSALRPDVRRAELEVEVAAQQRVLAQANVWHGSEVSIAGGLSDGQPAIGTVLTVPLPVYRNQAEVMEADARRRQAEARLEAVRQSLTMELDEAHQTAAIALTRYLLVTDSELPQARRFADNARRRYLAGEGSGLEAVEALRTLREVETEQLNALLDYREALARLERTVGTDLPQ